MKKHLFLAGASLMSLVAAAAPLSPSAALDRALGDSPARIRASRASFSLASTRQFDGQNAVYLFTRDDKPGFIVVTADDAAQSLAGFSDADFADEHGNLAPGFEYWLDEIARQVNYAVSRDSSPRKGERPVRETIGPLLTTTWNQSYPYNLMCPAVNGQLSVTGCVATSTAQVMKYHNWPETGEGQNAYNWNGQTLSMDFSETTFEWDKMLDNYSYSGDDEDAQNAVALLMKACGYSVSMGYSPYASGASSMAIAPALANYFKYDKSLRYLSRDWYSLLEWEEIIYNSLVNYGPVIYNGQSYEGGHSFVCDGYAGDGYFHINWGWGGMSDGDFLLDVLDPYEHGIGGADSGFNFMQDAIVDIRPDYDGTSQPQPILVYDGSLNFSYVRDSKSIKLSGMAYNPGPCSIPADAMAGIEMIPSDCFGNSLGDPIYKMFAFDGELPPMYGFRDVEFPVEDIPMQSYKIRLVYSLDGEEVLSVVVPNGYSDAVYARLTRSSGRFYPYMTEIPEFIAEFGSDSFYSEDELTVAGTASNDMGFESDEMLYVVLIGESVNKPVATASLDYLELEAGESTEFDFSFKFEDLTDVTPGTYRIALARNEQGVFYQLLSDPVEITYAGLTGISNTWTDSVESAREYFTIDGIFVSRVEPAATATSLPAGVYIVRCGDKTSKVVVK